MKPSKALAPLLALATITAAWPWPPAFLQANGLTGVRDLLDRRQQNNPPQGGGDGGSAGNGGSGGTPVGGNGGNGGSGTGSGSGNNPNPNNGGNGGNPSPSPSPSPSPKPQPKPTTDAATKTSSTKKTTEQPQTVKTTVTTTNGNGKKTTYVTTTTEAGTTKVPKPNIEDPAGGVSMLTPAVSSGMQFYRVGMDVTWVWKYTSVVVPPTRVNVLATYTNTAGAQAPSAFTLATDLEYKPTQTFIWDTSEVTDRGEALPDATYTLIIYDPDVKGGITQSPRPGYLGVAEQFYFGMYTALPYANLVPRFQCATCNAAFGQTGLLAIGFLTTMVGLSMGTFLWVAIGNGVFA